MQALVNVLVSTLVQVGAVLVLCLAAYLVIGRRRGGFAAYLGLIPAPWRAVGAGAAVGLAMAAALLAWAEIRRLAASPGSVPAEALAAGGGAATVAALAILALVKTSFSEELLYRGLIGKRLIGRFGFAVGNAVQAGLFGITHLALLALPQATPAVVGAMVVVTGALGWVAGWLNERLGGGSILPGWTAHGLANLVAYAVGAWTIAGG